MPSTFDSPPHDGAPFETFVRLLVAHEPHLRSFLRSLLPSWTEVDEAMQETSLTAWRKFDQFTPGSNFLAWAMAIARFEALKQRRTLSRERLVFSEAVIDLISTEAAAETESLARERSALETCVGQLGDAARELLAAAYQPGVKLHEVAIRSGRGVEAFYKTLQRLRARLLECVQRQLKQEPL